LNLNNVDKHVWSCSVLVGFSNKRLMNKIDEFEFFDLPREDEWRRNHTNEYNRKDRTPQNFNWLNRNAFRHMICTLKYIVMKVYQLNKSFLDFKN